MAKVDMHVHSRYSAHASEWFLKKLGAHESYTEPDAVFAKALANGMNFVTLTDHNQIEGSLYLQAKYPRKSFAGVEFTTYFPEDGCKIHVLVYGLTRSQFQELNGIRENIYNLRDYIQANQLAYSVAHATYAVNNRLKRGHLEKLLLLFDVFEGINGSREEYLNSGWMKILENLTPQQMDDLYARYGIEPISENPWVKGFTAGSDDHAGLFIGRTYTEIGAATPDDFLERIINKISIARGRHNNYQMFAFNIYKIAYDFSKEKKAVSDSLISQLSEFVFNDKSMSLRQRIKLKLIKNDMQAGVGGEFYDMIRKIQEGKEKDFEGKLKIVYHKLSDMADAFLMTLFQSLEKDLRQGNVFKLVRDISSFIPGIFLAAPFFSSLSQLFRGRILLNQMQDDYLSREHISGKRVLWFTDTIADMNGVAEMIKKTGWAAHNKNMDVRIAALIPPEILPEELPPNILSLPFFYSLPLPYYEKITLRIPSVLKAMEMICQAKPEEIVISTPGPMGLLGLLLSKLLNIKCTGIYHTDFTAQVQAISQAEDLAQVVKQYIKWFYSTMQEIKVPTRAYLDILEERGYQPQKLTYYRKSVDVELFKPYRDGSPDIRKMFKNPGDFTLLYAGRISPDKNLDLLLEVYQELAEKNINMNFMIAGDGPSHNKLKQKSQKFRDIRFLGRIKHCELPAYYNAADLLVFPSTTDTFGMVVLEAQACGLPVVVSEAGGPKEIVAHQKTGLVVKLNNVAAWLLAIKKMIDLKANQPEMYRDMQEMARQNVVNNYQIEKTLSDLFHPLEAATTISPDVKVPLEV